MKRRLSDCAMINGYGVFLAGVFAWLKTVLVLLCLANGLKAQVVPAHVAFARNEPIPELMAIGEALFHASKSGDMNQVAVSRLDLANYYLRGQQWLLASLVIRRGIDALDPTTDKWLVNQFLLLAAKVDFLKGKVRSSELILKSLLDDQKDSTGDSLRIKVLIELSSVYQHQGRGLQSWPLVSEAYSLAMNGTNIRQQASVLHQLGILSSDFGEMAVASDLFYRAALLYGRLGDSKAQAMVNLTLCTILTNAGLTDAAVGYAREAVDLYLRLPFGEHHQRLLGYAYNSLGMAYSSSNQIALARQSYLQAFQTWERIGDRKNQVFAADNLVNLALSEKNPEVAAQYLDVAMKLNGPMANDIQSAVLLHTRSRYLGSLQLPISAAKVAHEAADRLLQAGVLNLAVDAFGDVIRYEMANHNRDAALEAALRRQVLSDSLAHGLTSAAVASLQLHYNDQVNKQMMRGMQQEMKLTHLLLQRTRGYLSGFAFLSLIIFLLLMALIMQIRKKKRAYDALLEKNLQLMGLKAPGEGSLTPETAGSIGNEKASADQQKVIGNYSAIRERLQESMEIHYAYRNPELSLPALAQMLSTNSSYLSRVINEEFNSNFNAFINTYRIREACELLQAGVAQNQTLEAIGHQVGFSTRASFHAAFKKITGLTPGIYVDGLKGKGLIKNN